MHAVNYTPVAGHYRSGGRPARNNRAPGRKSWANKVVSAWFDMAGSTGQIMAAKPSEKLLFGLLVMSNIAFLFSWTLKGVAQPGGMHLLSLDIALLGLVSFVGRTCLMYLFAAAIGSVCRIVGGRGSWRDTRAAVFWGALVAAPFGILAAAISIMFTHLATALPIFGAYWILASPYWLGMGAFLWFMALGVAKVHGFRQT